MGDTLLPAGSQSKVVRVNGIRLHYVEAGTGPLALLIHGFPESWYSWRHQLPALADAGYRAVAIDVRGYGRSSAPTAVEDYRMLRHVADNVELVAALGADRAVVIGHDWGAPIAWMSALLRPDVFCAVAGLSVPYSPPSEHRPLAVMRMLAGDEEFYVEYFQEPGRAEAEIEDDIGRWLRGFLYSASGDAPRRDPGAPTMATIPAGGRMCDRFHDPDELPPWLREDDLAFYVAEFERTGFRGPLNRYRNVDRDWDDMAPWRGAPVDVPALFVGGDRDGPTIMGADRIAAFPQTLPQLHASVVLEGCGHWTQQERPDAVNDALVDFLDSVS